MHGPETVTAKPNGRDKLPIASLKPVPDGAPPGRLSLRPLLGLKPYLVRYRGILAASFLALLVASLKPR